MVVVAKLKAKAGEEAKMEEALRGMVAKVAQEQGTLTEINIQNLILNS